MATRLIQLQTWQPQQVRRRFPFFDATPAGNPQGIMYVDALQAGLSGPEALQAGISGGNVTQAALSGFEAIQPARI
jgi:hypothetical protein